MFFFQWWQGLLFGVFTTVLMVTVGYFFAGMWDRYEEKPRVEAVCHLEPQGH